MPKYISQIDVKPNHWYQDSKGERMLYLGMASQLRYDGGWHYPTSHIYLKQSILSRHFTADPNTIPVEVLLETMATLGVRHYCFSESPRKFCAELGKHPDAPLRGTVGNYIAFTFM